MCLSLPRRQILTRGIQIFPLTVTPICRATSLFPVPGDGCGNCSVEFHVHKNVSTGTEYYTVITTEEKAASCNGTCPEVSPETTTP